MVIMLVATIFKEIKTDYKFNVPSVKKSRWINSDSSELKINSMSFSSDGWITESPALKLTPVACGKCQQIPP